MGLERFAIIAGAAKCGTSSLFQYLAQHPAIAPSDPKEPNFFASDENWAKGRAWYESLFAFDPNQHKWAMDGSTYYTKHPDFTNAPERMLAFGGEYRIIYIVRDPIERVESHLRHRLMHGKITPQTPVEEAVVQTVLDQSSYYKQWTRYAERFAPEHLMLLDFDDVAERPGEVLMRVCAFLEIDADFAFKGLGQVHNKSKADGAAYKLMEKLPVSKNLRKLIPLWVREGIRNKLSKPLPEASTRLPEHVRDYVWTQIREDVKRFGDAFAFDVNKWELPEKL